MTRMNSRVPPLLKRLYLCTVIPTFLILASAPASVAATPDEGRDARLACRVNVESKGLPLAQVLSALTKATGVRLTCDGRVGDERLVLFIPDSSLGQVMRGIADLYRCTWSSDETADVVNYRLKKSDSANQQEEKLRREGVRQILQKLDSQLQNPSKGNTPESDWSAVYPDVLPILRTQADALVTDGTISIPVGSLRGATRERVILNLQSVLDLQRAFFEKADAVTNALRGDGPKIRAAESFGPPAKASDSVIVAEVVLAKAPQIWVGLRSTTGTFHVWFVARDESAATTGVALYRDRPLESPAMQGAADDFDEPVAPGSGQGGQSRDWIERLQKLSKANKVAVFSDCYSDFQNGLDGHARGAALLPTKGSLRMMLDRFCNPGEKSSTRDSHSFWWRKDNAALIRSTSWLWDSEGVLPSSLCEKVVASWSKRKPLGSEHFRELAGLTRFQVQKSGPLVPSYDAWIYAIQLPARMEPRAGALLFQPAGLRWDNLTPASRSILLPFLPVATEAKPQYQAAITTMLTDLPSQGGIFASMQLSAQWGFNHRGMVLLVPLPGTESKRLSPAGPTVRVLSRQ